MVLLCGYICTKQSIRCLVISLVWCLFAIMWANQAFSDSEIVVVCVCVCVDSEIFGNLQNLSSAARLPFTCFCCLLVGPDIMQGFVPQRWLDVF